MNDFIASNGIKIKTDEAEDTRLYVLENINSLDGFDHLGPGDMRALREFFEAESDERLGRWRWPDNPRYVVYPSALYLTPSDEDLVQVVNEENGQSHRARRDDPDGLFGFFSEAGAAYFDAHSGPKPWHDAKPGEVWALTLDEAEGIFLHAGGSWYGQGDMRVVLKHPIRDVDVTAGRRIWPEVSS